MLLFLLLIEWNRFCLWQDDGAVFDFGEDGEDGSSLASLLPQFGDDDDEEEFAMDPEDLFKGISVRTVSEHSKIPYLLICCACSSSPHSYYCSCRYLPSCC